MNEDDFDVDVDLRQELQRLKIRKPLQKQPRLESFC